MSDPRERVKKIRQQEVLEAFRDSDEPVLVTSEVSDQIGSVTQETVLDDLKAMRGDLVNGKKTKQGWVWWVTADNPEDGREKIATDEQLRRAVADLATSRLDIRALTASLAILALLSVGGVAIYLMLETDVWLLPISQQSAILYNYTLMVTAGMVIVSSGLVVLVTEWLRRE